MRAKEEMSFHIRTYGCQMNERDSEAARALLERNGYRLEEEDAADVVIVNTCSVRDKAEEKARGKLGLLTATKRRRSGRVVGVIGCMAQRLGEALTEELPGLDFVLGPNRLSALPSAIEAARRGVGPVVDTGETRDAAEFMEGHAETGVSVFVNILLGCNRGCAYCVVPRVRGREWSRPAASVLREVEAVAARGAREIVLLGQSVMAYGRSNAVWENESPSPGGYREPFPRLLEAVAAVPGIARVRFTSGHPSGCTEELARAMAEIPAVCPHIHLPVQSGSDRVLARMGRGYNVEQYLAAVERLRCARPELAVTTDIIVGFPGETEEDFEATRGFMDAVGFDQAFIFKYSPRPDTPAFAWPDSVSAEEKARRNAVLLADQDRRNLASRRRLIGRAVDVLVEGPSLRNVRRWAGRTPVNHIVTFDQMNGIQPGDIVRVLVRRATAQSLHGEVSTAHHFGASSSAAEKGGTTA